VVSIFRRHSGIAQLSQCHRKQAARRCYQPSGFVPILTSKRALNEYWVLESTPLAVKYFLSSPLTHPAKRLMHFASC
jgi:hypothetical protein